MASKSIFIISSYTISKFTHFLDTMYVCMYVCIWHSVWLTFRSWLRTLCSRHRRFYCSVVRTRETFSSWTKPSPSAHHRLPSWPRLICSSHSSLVVCQTYVLSVTWSPPCFILQVRMAFFFDELSDLLDENSWLFFCDSMSSVWVMTLSKWFTTQPSIPLG